MTTELIKEVEEQVKKYTIAEERLWCILRPLQQELEALPNALLQKGCDSLNREWHELYQKRTALCLLLPEEEKAPDAN